MNSQALPQTARRPRISPPYLGLWLRTVVRTRLALPLYRNGYALIASSLLTSVTGLAYWVIAAHAYSAAAVGVSAALISA